MKKLTSEERELRRLDRAEDARINALYASGSMAHAVAPAPTVAEPTRYTVVTLPSAYNRKLAAEKAARTRRLRRQGLA